MMMSKSSLPETLRRLRKVRGLSQEAFSDVSSRTYLSSLERGLKSPTLNKLEDICAVLEVQPLTLLALAYAAGDAQGARKLLAQVKQEVESLATDSDF